MISTTRLLTKYSWVNQMAMRGNSTNCSMDKFDLRLSPRVPSSKPIVFLFGWAGSTDKLINKYADIYHKTMDCNTLTCILPTKYIFFHNDKIPEIATNFLSFVKDQGLRGNNILIHCFSDTGLMVYHGFQKVLMNDPEKYNFNIRGCVYDSCPGPIAEVNATRMMALLTVLAYCCRRDGYSNLQTFKTIYDCLINRFLASYSGRLNGNVQSGLLPGLKLMDNTWSGDFVKHQRDLPANWPELFIFSKKDWYVSYRYLNNVIEKHVKSGRDVDKLFLQNSDHVGHLRAYKDEYVSSINNFVHKCFPEFVINK